MTTYIRKTSMLLGLLTWLALCYHGAVVQAQEVIKLEYYIDTDPGFGKGQNVPITPGTDVTKSFQVDINSFSKGFHNLYVRALVKQYQVQEGDVTATKGGWSLTTVRTFYKEELSGAATAADVVKGEYFVDADPGYGRGTNIPLTRSQHLSNLSFAFDITSLPAGFHNLYVRFKDANGKWGTTMVRTFYKENLDQGTTPTPNIVKGEFFIDTDPGFGRGSNIALTPGTNLSGLSFTADLSNIPGGFHQLYTRFKDAKGNWGQTQVRSIYKEVFSSADPLPNLVKAEYFVDTDPGFGKGKNIPVTPNTELSNLTFSLDMTDISIGNHKLYVRVQDANGKWSLTSVSDFEVESPQDLYVTVGTITDQLCAGQRVDVPFTVNAPFGSNNVFTAQLSDAAGNFSSPVTIGTLQDRNSGTITANIPENTAAGSAYRIRVVASSPTHTSTPNSTNLTIKRVPLLAGITGDVSTCLGMKQYSMPLETGVTYDWRLSGGGTLTATGNTATVTWSSAGLHTITVTPANDCGNGQERTLQVNVYNAAPTQTPTISASGRWLYASAAGPNVSGYQWYVNGGAISGANSSSFYVYDNGLYTVRYTNPCGNGPESNGISFSGDKQNQTISFTAISEKTYGDEPFALSATASSGLPVSFSVVGGPATVSGNMLTITGGGTITVRASQGGNDTYNAAPPVDNSFVVKPAAATVALTNLSQTYNGQPRPVTVTTTPTGLAVSVTYNGNSAVPVDAGSYTVAASIADPSYKGSNTGTLVVNKAQQTITLESVPTKTYGDDPFQVLAAASSGLPVSLSISTEPDGIASISSGNIITILGAGTITVTAKQAGNGNYLVAADVSATVTVRKADQTIAFAALQDKTYGDAPFALDASASSGLNVGFRVKSGPATISGTTLTISGAGTVEVEAYQDGNANYNAAPLVVRAFQVNKASQSITFAALADKTYGDAPFELSATASSGLEVSFSIVSGPATISGNILTMTGTGTVVVRASQAGDQNHLAASSVDRSFQVNSPDKLPQTITFAALADKTYGDAPIQLLATASSGLAVSFRVANGPASIAGNTLTILGAGTVTVEASQAGDDTYDAAAPVSRSFTVFKATPTISWNKPADIVYGTALSAAQLNATASVLGTYTYSPVSGTVLNAGADQELRVSFTPQDTDNYHAASAAVKITVNPAPVTVQFGGLAQVYNGQPREVTVVTSPAGVTYSLSYDGATEPPVNAGSYAVAVAITDPNYSGAGAATLLVDKAQQTILLAAIADKTYGDAPVQVQASSSSGLQVELSLSSEPAGIASITGSAITLLGAGEVTVTAKQAGNENYYAAAEATRTFTVNKASQSITFAALADKTYGDVPFELSASASSGLAVAFNIVSGPATISGTTLTMTGTGTVVVRATQGGDANYLAAATVDRAFEVRSADRLPQTITFAAIADRTYGDAPFQLSATASSGLEVSFRIVSGPASLVGNVLTVLGAGSITVEALQAGNATYHPATAENTFIVHKATPVVSWNRPANIAEGTALSSLQLNATASVSGTFTYTPAAGTVLAAGNNLELSVEFVPQDAANYHSVLHTRNYITVNGAPVLTVTGETTVKEHEQLTLLSSATDVNGDVITFGLIGDVPEGMRINAATGAITWTPSEAQGPASYSIKVRATDNNTPVLYTEQTLDLTVEEVNVAPVLANVPAEVTINELANYTFTATFSDEDLPANKLTLSLVGAPQGAVMSQQGVFSWTPTEAQGPGEYTFKVRVTDDGNPVLFSEKEVSITVNEVNQAPVLAAIPAQAFSSGETVRFTASASDADLPVQQLTYSLVAVVGENFPQGATMQAGTGTFEWNSTGHTHSEYRFKVRVEDSYGAFAEHQVSMSLRSSNPAPVLATVGDKILLAGSTLAFMLTATDDGLPNGKLTFSASSLPKGASLNSGTGAFTWTPTGGQVGAYAVTFTVSDGSLSASESITIDVVRKTAEAAPQIDSFDPASGTVGTLVTIAGREFINVNAVLFNGNAAVYRVLNSSMIEAIVPVGATTGNITVSTTGGSASSKQRFTVLAPVISSFTPSSGPVGTIVTITGDYFVDVTAVAFNGVSVTEILSSTATELVVRVPAGATSGKIGVITASGSTSSKGRYTVTGGLAATTISTFEVADEANFMAYPNPFNGKTTISFVLQEEGAYTVSLYDAKGALISALKQGKAESGERQQIELDGMNLDKGLYLLRLQTTDKVRTLKIVLDK